MTALLLLLSGLASLAIVVAVVMAITLFYMHRHGVRVLRITVEPADSAQEARQ
jgi:hypothetical protein